MFLVRNQIKYFICDTSREDVGQRLYTMPITLKGVTYETLPSDGRACAYTHLGRGKLSLVSIVIVTSLCGWLYKQRHLLEAALSVAWLLL